MKYFKINYNLDEIFSPIPEKVSKRPAAFFFNFIFVVFTSNVIFVVFASILHFWHKIHLHRPKVTKNMYREKSFCDPSRS